MLLRLQRRYIYSTTHMRLIIYLYLSSLIRLTSHIIYFTTINIIIVDCVLTKEYSVLLFYCLPIPQQKLVYSNENDFTYTTAISVLCSYLWHIFVECLDLIITTTLFFIYLLYCILSIIFTSWWSILSISFSLMSKLLY
jgi:hypothetical protein